MSRAACSDPASQANNLELQTKHISFDWTLDWSKKIVQGSATHQLQVLKDGVKEAIFDTSFLEIEKVTVDGQTAKWELGERHHVLGSALHIPLAKDHKQGDEIELRVDYSTTSQCTTLGWLTAEQTPSKKLPFVYSQSQAIHSRSLFPCQDTPSVKITYSAKVRSSLPEATVLLSARRTSPPLDYVPTAAKPTEWQYHQPTRIPCYLVAIAAGNVRFAPLGPRTGVWADPDRLDACVTEFKQDTERFLSTAEKIMDAPYDWDRYDVIVLPESFPYGGMENANLTFLTPTLLADGTRDNVDVIAHEASHSWHGNHISCSNWTNFWINEGSTTYLERLILRELHGEASRGFSYLIGRNALQESFEQMPARYRSLVIDYQFGDDPDEGRVLAINFALMPSDSRP